MIILEENEHRSTVLWRERINCMAAVVTGPSFPYWLCPFHSWKWTVVVKWDSGFYTDFLHAWASCSQWARGHLLCGGPVEGTWKNREAFKKYLSIRKAFHLASARSSAQRSVSLLLMNWLRGPELFNRSGTDGGMKFSWFPAPGIQGGFHHKLFLSNFQWNSSVTLLLLRGTNSLWGKDPFPLPDNVFNNCGGLCRQVASSQWPADLHVACKPLSRWFLIGGKRWLRKLDVVIGFLAFHALKKVWWLSYYLN